MVAKFFNSMSKIEIHKNDIVNARTEAVVNAANSDLHRGGGVCGDIFDAAGKAELTRECSRYHGCPVGGAVITGSCGLKQSNGIEYIIHAVGPDCRVPEEKANGRELLYSAYREALKLAKENRCRSVTFPLISAGIYEYPEKEAWEVALSACRDFISENPDYDLTIVFVRRHRSEAELGKSILKGSQPEAADTGKAGYVFFWLDNDDNGYLSNWYKSPFTVEGVEYWCVEQYMMAHKALVFNDLKRYQIIMRSIDQKEIKSTGRDVESFDSSVWSACKEEIVYNACYAKFSQNERLKALLLGTAGMKLAEASPRDKIWGIGLDATSAGSTPEAAWPGQNLLGKLLERVRTNLASD